MKVDKHSQPHDKTLGQLKSDMDSCHLRVLQLHKVYLNTETKRDALKKRKIAEGLAIYIEADEEATSGSIFDRFVRLKALLVGYCWLGCLEEFRILDPEDDRDPAARAADPRYIPLAEFGPAMAYADHFLRAATDNIPGTKIRPTLESVLDAEIRTREYAFKQVREAHLEGKTISISTALTQALTHCYGFWRFSPAQGRNNAAPKKGTGKGNSKGKSSGKGFNKGTGKGK